MSSTSHYTTGQQHQLLDLARTAIAYGLSHHEVLHPDPKAYDEALREIRASFVTLNIHDSLRGCIGTLEACRPLVTDIAHNAHAAAFSDPRFPPVTASELPHLAIHISILTPPEDMTVTSEDNLLAQLQPGIDGLILEDNYHRGTFLPSVWESLPDPATFLAHLKLKAGLPPGYWSASMRFRRYHTEMIE